MGLGWTGQEGVIVYLFGVVLLLWVWGFGGGCEMLTVWWCVRLAINTKYNC